MLLCDECRVRIYRDNDQGEIMYSAKIAMSGITPAAITAGG